MNMFADRERKSVKRQREREAVHADISCVLCKTGADGKIALFPVGRLQKQEGNRRGAETGVLLRLPFVPPLSLRCHVSVQNGGLIKTLLA